MCDIKLEVRLRFLGRERYNQEISVDGREKSVGNKENEICMKLDGTMKQSNPGSERQILYSFYVLSLDYPVKYVYLCGSKYR